MKSMRLGARFTLCALFLAALPAAAAEKPVNISLFPPLALAKPEDSVTAVRWNLIYGKNTSVKVLDFGLANHTTTGLSSGLAFGGINYTEGQVSGLQFAGININMGSTKGAQVATFNYAKNAGGLQLAFLNYAEKIEGVQIGAINIIKEGGFLPVCIIANWNKGK